MSEPTLRPARLTGPSPSVWLRLISRAYGVPAPVDYGREGNWLLLSAGTGLLLSILDQEPRFRWALDVDLLTPAEMVSLGRWLGPAETIVDRICAVGWFSDPRNGEPLARSLRGCRRRPLTYFGACPIPAMYAHTDRAETLADFLARLRSS